MDGESVSSGLRYGHYKQPLESLHDFYVLIETAGSDNEHDMAVCVLL